MEKKKKEGADLRELTRLNSTVDEVGDGRLEMYVMSGNSSQHLTAGWKQLLRLRLLLANPCKERLRGASVRLERCREPSVLKSLSVAACNQTING